MTFSFGVSPQNDVAGVLTPEPNSLTLLEVGLVAVVGASGLKRVEYWLRSPEEALPEAG